jgi:hypothetical protein
VSDEQTWRRVILADGTSWPDPRDFGDLEWILRYGDPTSVRFVAAEVVAAFRALIDSQPEAREQRCRQLRVTLHHVPAPATQPKECDASPSHDVACCNKACPKCGGSGWYTPAPEPPPEDVEAMSFKPATTPGLMHRDDRLCMRGKCVLCDGKRRDARADTAIHDLRAELAAERAAPTNPVGERDYRQEHVDKLQGSRPADTAPGYGLPPPTPEVIEAMARAIETAPEGPDGFKVEARAAYDALAAVAAKGEP